MEIIAVPLEHIVRLEMNDNIKVARRSPGGSGVTVALGAKSGALFNSGRNAQTDPGALFDPANATAGFAGVGDGLAGSIAVGTGLLNLKKAT